MEIGCGVRMGVAGDRDGPWMWQGVGMDVAGGVAGGRDGCGWG